MTEWALRAARLVEIGSALVLFGSALFLFYAIPSGARPSDIRDTGLRGFWVLAAALGLVSTLVWLSAEANLVAGAWTAFGDLITDTRFGRIAALRAGAFAVALAACAPVRSERTLGIVLCVLGGAIVASIAWTGHGAIDKGLAGLLHQGADVIHLLTAGIWLGALAPLSAMILRAYREPSCDKAEHIAFALARFSMVGPTVVALLTVSGMVNTWYLVGIGRWRALFQTPYGLSLLAKVAVFAGMLALAANNRLRLAPRLERQLVRSSPPAPALSSLCTSLLAESALALVVLALVALLGTLEPPIAAS